MDAVDWGSILGAYGSGPRIAGKGSGCKCGGQVWKNRIDEGSFPEASGHNSGLAGEGRGRERKKQGRGDGIDDCGLGRLSGNSARLAGAWCGCQCNCQKWRYRPVDRGGAQGYRPDRTLAEPFGSRNGQNSKEYCNRGRSCFRSKGRQEFRPSLAATTNQGSSPAVPAGHTSLLEQSKPQQEAARRCRGR